MSASYEEVLQHLLEAHGEHLRTTESDPLSLGDFVTVNYVNPLYVRAKAHAEAHPERVIRFAEDESCECSDGGHRDRENPGRCLCGGKLNR